MSEEIINAVQEEQISEVVVENNQSVPAAENVETPSNESESLLGENYLQEVAEKSLKEIVEIFENLVDRADQQEMYKYADGLKAAFYKALKREKIASGFNPPSQDVPEVSETAENETETAAKSEEQAVEQTVSRNPFDEVERGFKTLYAKYRSLRNAYLAQVEKNKEENLAVKLQIIEELKSLVENQEDLSKTFPAFRAIQTKWRESGPVPAKNVKDIYETYQHNVEKFYDYVKINNELRDLDFKKNLEIKERLCAEAEALIDEENIVNAFAKLQKLHEEWKELGPVDKEHRETIWERFKEATARINKKHQAHFEGLKEQQKENLEKKTVLCEKVEALAEEECKDSSQWNAASKQIEEIQKEWKTIGFAAKKENQRIYDRFRAACDKFFEKKRLYYNDFKDSMLKNYEAKVAICEQAEILSESTDWKNSKDALIELQKKWKEIGPVSRKKSDAIWNRFRAACDKFFDNKEKNYGGVDSQFVENLHKKLALIEEIKAYEPASDRSDLNALRNFTNAWNEIGFVPFREKEKVQDAFRTALNEKFPEYRSGYEGKKRSEKGSRNADSGKSERDKLLQKYHKIESEIATYENNMGFFANSKNAETFINGILQKIEAAKAELLELEEKIKTIE